MEPGRILHNESKAAYNSEYIYINTLEQAMGQNTSPSAFTLLLTWLFPALPAGIITWLAGLNDPVLMVLIFLFLFAVINLAIKVITPVYDYWTGQWSLNIQSDLSGFKKRYLKYVAARSEHFDVKGISTQGPHTLDLNKVFVDLSIASDAQRFTKDPIAIPSELTSGQHSIWEYVKNPMLKNLVVIGPPGSGKTTLLRFIALTLCSRKTIKHEKAPNKLPVLLYLRDHADKITENAEVSLRELLVSTLKDINVPPNGWFEKRFLKGDCLIMLDGLDEIGDPAKRKNVAKWVEEQTEQYSDCRFIISSRPGGYQNNPLSRVSALQVRPFNRDQQRQFIHNWYLANEIMAAQKDDVGAAMRAEKEAEDLITRINNSYVLSDLAVNPLLLTMIASLHRAKKDSLPNGRAELYAEICDVFLGKRRAAFGVEDDLPPQQKQCILQVLAYTMMQGETLEINIQHAIEIIREPLKKVSEQIIPEAFLKMIEDNSGLLIERENGIYSFSHFTFQEYLTAQYIQAHQLEDELRQYVHTSWWHETIRLYSAQNNATEIIKACLDVGDVNALMLAVQCLDEALAVESSVRKRALEIVEDWADSPKDEQRQVAGQVLLKLRLNRLIRVDEARYIDEQFITHVEYQLFIDEMRQKKIYIQPDHWDEVTYQSGEGRTPIVGVRASDAEAFCAWLTEQEEGDHWVYQLPLANELVQNEQVGYWAKQEDKISFTFPENREIPSIETLEIYINNTRDRARDLDLDRALDLALARARALVRARLYTQYILLKEYVPRKKENLEKTLLNKLNVYADACLEALISLMILEERRKGNLKAFEGIRIIKQRRN
jgi:hypothetical protein